jgi:hypothetical protein
MLEAPDSPLTYEQTITWLNNKISNGDPSRHPFDSNHVNIRRLVVIRKKLIESRKTDIGIKMFIKQHRIL